MALKSSDILTKPNVLDADWGFAGAQPQPVSTPLGRKKDMVRPNSDAHDPPDRRKRKNRSFAIALALSSVFFGVLFDRLLSGEHHSFFEWIGLLFVLYIVPSVVYFLLLPKDMLSDMLNDRTEALAMFVGTVLILSLCGMLVGGLVSFLVGIMFYVLT